MSEHHGSPCSHPPSLVFSLLPRALCSENLQTHWGHDEKLDMLSLGIKHCTQSKVKLALSGLLNPMEGVI